MNIIKIATAAAAGLAVSGGVAATSAISASARSASFASSWNNAGRYSVSDISAWSDRYRQSGAGPVPGATVPTSAHCS